MFWEHVGFQLRQAKFNPSTTRQVTLDTKDPRGYGAPMKTLEITYQDAYDIIQAAVVCENEGIGPVMDNLITRLKLLFPALTKEYITAGSSSSMSRLPIHMGPRMAALMDDTSE